MIKLSLFPPFAILAYLFKFKIGKKLVLFDRIIFDFILSIFIREADIYHMWAGFSYMTIKKLEKLQKVENYFRKILPPYIRTEINIDEAKKRNIDLKFDLKMDINRQVREYDLADFIIVPSCTLKFL